MSREEAESKIAEIEAKLQDFDKEIHDMYRDNFFSDEEKARYQVIAKEQEGLRAQLVELQAHL